MNNTINWNTTLNMLLSPAEAALLAVIMANTEDKKTVILSYPQLSKLANVPATSIHKHVTTLEKLRLITISVNKRTNGNAYLLCTQEFSGIISRISQCEGIDNKLNTCNLIRKKRISPKVSDNKNDSTKENKVT